MTVDDATLQKWRNHVQHLLELVEYEKDSMMIADYQQMVKNWQAKIARAQMDAIPKPKAK